MALPAKAAKAGSSARSSAMILCAGLGTRLRPLTEWVAKPMVPIGDRPAVAHVVDHVRLAGYDPIALNVHHRPDDLRTWAATSRIGISEEAELLGTAGGIARAAPLLGDGDVLVWNGDILATPDLAALRAAHHHVATLAITPRALGEGNVGVTPDGRIVRLRRESFPALGAETSSGDFTGIHIVGASLRTALPSTGCIVGDVYLPALRRGARLDAHVLEVSFTDVGSLASYVEANRRWLGARGAWSAPDAVVRAPIDGSIIGAGARIEAATTNCIVWPNSVVTTALDQTIVTPFGNVAIRPT